MKTSVFALSAIATVLAGLSATQVSLAEGRDLSSVNGSVEATAGQSYGRISTVNGDVRVSRGVTANEAKTVNGEIDIEADAKVGTVSTVNGSLDIGDGANVEHTASTVNGNVELGRKSRVGGDVSTVSGNIDLTGAEVGGGIETRNGNIKLEDGARVHGGILVKKNNSSGWNWGRNEDDHPIKVFICATCVVDGDLRFERATELRVEPGAKIGQVIGDKVTRL